MLKSKKQCEREILSTLRVRREVFLKELHLCSLQPKEKHVHDLRVSTRRLLGILELIEEIHNFKKGKQIKRKTKRVLRLFGRLRDIQVQQGFLNTLLGEFPELESFLKELEIKEEKERRTALRELDRLDKTHLREGLRGLNKKADRDLKGKKIQETLEMIMIRDYHRVMESHKAVTLDDVETFHRLRIDCKKFRYRMEIMESLLVNERNFSDPLRKIQDQLGEIQDVTVLLEEVKGYPELWVKDPRKESFQGWLENRLEKRMKDFYGKKEELFMPIKLTPGKIKKKEKVTAMSEKDKPKKLCKLAKKKDYLEDNLEDYMNLVGKPKFLCKKCGRAGEKEKSLCKSKKLN